MSSVIDDSARQRLSIVVSAQSSQFSAMSYSGELTDTFARIAEWDLMALSWRSEIRAG